MSAEERLAALVLRLRHAALVLSDAYPQQPQRFAAAVNEVDAVAAELERVSVLTGEVEIRIKRAARVAAHSPHDQDGEPNEGFPVCSVCGAIQTGVPTKPGAPDQRGNANHCCDHPTDPECICRCHPDCECVSRYEAWLASRPVPDPEPRCETCGRPDRGHDDSHGFHPAVSR